MELQGSGVLDTPSPLVGSRSLSSVSSSSSPFIFSSESEGFLFAGISGAGSEGGGGEGAGTARPSRAEGMGDKVGGKERKTEKNMLREIDAAM